MDKSFQLSVSKPPVSGKPFAHENVALRRPEEAELCAALTSMCCLSGTALKWHVPCWLMKLPRAGAGAHYPLCPMLLSILMFGHPQMQGAAASP